MIKNLLNKYINNVISRIIKKQSKIQQEQFALQAISGLFNESHFIPFTRWSISPSTIQHILNDIEINKRNCIVEFGAGSSTLYIAKLLKTKGSKASFFSIESDEKWARTIENDIKKMQLDDFVTIIYAPITKISKRISHGQQTHWYDTQVLDSIFVDIHAIDLILVDGPHGKTTPFARYSAIPYLQTKLSTSYSIYLDDIGRDEEKEIVSEWKKSLNCNTSISHRYALLSSDIDLITMPFRLKVW
ncbi:hypothetical protein WNY78_05750 [Psychroserpens sp. AS72]|uniref:hypothetical protein n=1 Tax=Psychroserpens sp. AS72 TaxID=3135775 RepID=UPI00317B57C1